MKCPNCGYIPPLSTTAEAGRNYRISIEKRLTEYGYPEKMSPQKSQACSAIRKAISIRTGIPGRAGGSMSSEDSRECISMLESILPGKESEELKAEVAHGMEKTVSGLVEE